jgi:hypothetical protein
MSTNTIYQSQLQYIFDRPVTEPVWYWSQDDGQIYPFDNSTMQSFEFIERLCQQPKIDLAIYTDNQIAIGFEYIFNGSGSNLCHDFKSAEVLLERKIAAIKSLFNLFKEVLNERCISDTSANKQVMLSKLNNICYMFWDVSPFSTWLVFDNKSTLISEYDSNPEGFLAIFQAEYTNMDNETKHFYQAIANVMERCLALNNLACVESGLHGLGHKVPHLPKIAQPILDKYIKSKPKNATLLDYAKAARTGYIL